MARHQKPSEALKETEARLLTFLSRQKRMQQKTNRTILAISNPSPSDTLGDANSLLSLETAMNASFEQNLELVAIYLLSRYCLILRVNKNLEEMDQEQKTVKTQLKRASDFWQDVQKKIVNMYGERILELALILAKL